MKDILFCSYLFIYKRKNGATGAYRHQLYDPNQVDKSFKFYRCVELVQVSGGVRERENYLKCHQKNLIIECSRVTHKPISYEC